MYVSMESTCFYVETVGGSKTHYSINIVTVWLTQRACDIFLPPSGDYVFEYACLFVCVSNNTKIN